MTPTLCLPIGPDSTLVDGDRRWWPDDLDLAGVWIDRGPSPAGNAGPYLKAARGEGDDRTVHRLYCRWGTGSRVRVGGTAYTVERVYPAARDAGRWEWVLVLGRVGK